jgi:AcrR family transcriptional regulator
VEISVDERTKKRLEEAERRKRRRAEQEVERLERQQRRIDNRRKKVNSRKRESAAASPLAVWTRGDRRGRQPKLSRDDIVRTAIRLADAEGFDALSMRRLAQELGTGTMSLYHYVQTKDELLALVVNELISGVTLTPDESMPAHWRDALKLIALRTRDVVLAHSWILDVKSDPVLGPNSVLHFEQTLQAMQSMHATDKRRLEIAMLIDEYVYGYCWQNRSNRNHRSSSDKELEYITELLTTGDFPELSRLVDTHGSAGVWTQVIAVSTDVSRFERHLDILLDGIETSLAPLPSRQRKS